jgi:hypothetical protein
MNLPAHAQQTVSLVPSVPYVFAGANFSSTFTNTAITVTLANGTDPVDLAVQGVPAGVTASLTTHQVTGNATVYMTVSVANAAKGFYPLTISASGGATASATVTVVVGELWTAASLENMNWSTAANWSTGVAPVAGDDVIFGDAGVNTNYLESSMALNSLTYVRFETGTNHNTVIASNATLSVVGTNGLAVNVDCAPTDNRTIAVSISGQGASFVVSNQNANFSVSSVSGGNNGTTFDMSGLDNFRAEVNRFGVGDASLVNAGGVGYQLIRAFSFARTNLVKTGFVGNHEGDDFITNAMTFFNNLNYNNGSAMTANLGISNAFYIDSIGVGLAKAGSAANTVRFNPAFLANNPVAIFRGPQGGRVSFLGIGVDSGLSANTARTRGVLNFSGGTVDMLVDTIWLGKNRINHTGGNQQEGTLTFDSGIVDANTVRAGYKVYPNDNYSRGSVNVFGTNALLIVNTVLELGHTPQEEPIGSTMNSYGRLVISSNGMARVNTITVGLYSTNNLVRLTTGGSLEVSNTIASPDVKLTALDMTDSKLTLHVNGTSTNIHVGNLVTSGLNNVINIASVTGLSEFPVQVPLISYEVTPAMPNFILGRMPSGLNGAIVNNTTNRTVDLSITTNMPKTLVWRGYVNADWDTTTANWMDPSTQTPTTFHDGDYAVFDDAAGVPANINIATDIVPGQSATTPGIAMTNATVPYIFSGPGGIRGSAAIAKWGQASLTIRGYTEISVAVNEGTVIIPNSGVVGAVVVSSGANLSNAGSIVGGLTCAGTAPITGTITGPVILQSGAQVTNSGMIDGLLTMHSGSLLNNAGTLNNVGSPVIAANATLVNSGDIFAVNLGVSGKLKDMGTGTINLAGILTINQNGTFEPGGDGIGTTSVRDIPQPSGYPGRVNMALGSFNVFKVDLGKTRVNTVLSSPYVDFGGNNQLAACILVITNIGAVPFRGGETLQLFINPNDTIIYHPGGLSYPVIQPSSPGRGLVWDISNLRTNGILRVASIPTTPTNVVQNITVNPSNVVIDLSWPAEYIGWQLQQQQNPLNVGLSTNWTAINGSGLTNQVSLTNSRSPICVFYRLVLP